MGLASSKLQTIIAHHGLPNAAIRGVGSPSSSLSTTVGNLGAPRQGSETTGGICPILSMAMSSSSTALSLLLSLSDEELDAFELEDGCHITKLEDSFPMLLDLSRRSRAAITAVNRARLCSINACGGG